MIRTRFKDINEQQWQVDIFNYGKCPDSFSHPMNESVSAITSRTNVSIKNNWQKQGGPIGHSITYYSSTYPDSCTVDMPIFNNGLTVLEYVANEDCDVYILYLDSNNIIIGADIKGTLLPNETFTVGIPEGTVAIAIEDELAHGGDWTSEYTVRAEQPQDNVNVVEYDCTDEEPLHLNFEGDTDNIFKPIIYSGGTLNLVTEHYIQELITNAYNKRIIINKVIEQNNNIIYDTVLDGFINPDTYSQAYSKKYDELEVNFVNCLSVLKVKKYVRVPRNGGEFDTNKVSVKDILFNIFQTYTNVEFLLVSHAYATTLSDVSKNISQVDNIIDHLLLDENIFFDENENPLMCTEVIERICTYLNMTMFTNGSAVYMANWNEVFTAEKNWFHIYDIKNDTISAYDFSHIGNRNLRKDMLTSDEQTITFTNLANKIKLTDSFYNAADLVKTSEKELNTNITYIRDKNTGEPYVINTTTPNPKATPSASVLTVITQFYDKMNGMTNNSSGVPVLNWFGNTWKYAPFNPDIDKTCCAIMRQQTIFMQNGWTDDFQISFDTPVLAFKHHAMDYDDRLFVNCFTFKREKSIYLKGTQLIISGDFEFVSPQESQVQNATFPVQNTQYCCANTVGHWYTPNEMQRCLQCSIRIGNYYWWGIPGQLGRDGWQPYFNWVQIPLDMDSNFTGKIKNNVTYKSNLSDSGYAIKFDETIIGDFEMKIFIAPGYPHNIYYDTVYAIPWTIWKNLKVKRATVNNTDGKDDIVYENVVDLDSIFDEKEIEFKINTNTKANPSVISFAYYDYWDETNQEFVTNYLDEVYPLYLQTNNANYKCKMEDNAIHSYYSQYCKPNLILDVDILDGVNPIFYFTDISSVTGITGKKMIPIKASWNVKNCQNTLSMVEYIEEQNLNMYNVKYLIHKQYNENKGIAFEPNEKQYSVGYSPIVS